MVSMNIFRILADLSHFASKCVLIWAIHSNKSAEGVSLITQLLYAAVFCFRYLDLFWVPPTASWWNFFFKNFYIWSSIYIILIMTRVYPRTREREKAWKIGAYATAASLVSAPLIVLIFEGKRAVSLSESLWAFSIILESVCVLPQLLLLRQTTVPTVIDSFYLILLGSYRAWYILNWIYRASTEHRTDPIPDVFGVIQTLLYADFAWVYYTRQRVKLRHGGLVDSDDLRKSWFVKRVIGGNRNSSIDEERPTGIDDDDGVENAAPRTTNRWGARAVSVSADDTLHDHHRTKAPKSSRPNASGTAEEQQGILEDDGLLSEDEDAVPINPADSVLNSVDAWNKPSPQH